MKIPIVLCRHCKKWMPHNITVMERKKKPKAVLKVVWCVKCEFVKNVDSIPKIKWVGKKWMKDHGWTIGKGKR